MCEVQERGERVMPRDALSGRYGLSDRQRTAVAHALEHGTLALREYERLCPGVSRRTLQRDLRAMVDKGLLAAEGATNRLHYRLAGTRPQTCDRLAPRLAPRSRPASRRARRGNRAQVAFPVPFIYRCRTYVSRSRRRFPIHGPTASQTQNNA